MFYSRDADGFVRRRAPKKREAALAKYFVIKKWKAAFSSLGGSDSPFAQRSRQPPRADVANARQRAGGDARDGECLRVRSVRPEAYGSAGPRTGCPCRCSPPRWGT